MIGIEQRVESRMDLGISPALVAASEMLELSSLALESMVEEVLAQNPVLERLDVAECAVCGDRWPTRCPVCASPGSPSRLPGSLATAVTPNPRLDHPAPETDADILLDAVRLAVRQSDVRIAEYVVASLDHHGRLDQSPGDIAKALATDQDAVLRVLAAVRENGPPGVGATTAAECLLLQLDALDLDEVVYDLARSVIAEHLPALAKGHFAAIASALGVDQQRVVQVLHLIREQLLPYPAFEGSAPPSNSRVVPEVIIRERSDAPGEFDVELVEPRRMRVGISPNYLQLVEKPSPNEASQLRSLVFEARSLLGQLRDRWETLRLVTTCTVERQKDFLRNGSRALRPLTRAEVAASLGLHESIVSRAVSGRYAMLPSDKIVPMSTFFSSSGGLAEELKRIVTSERQPLSDEEVAARLCLLGYSAARRTVTKYRNKLGIPAAGQRGDVWTKQSSQDCRLRTSSANLTS